MTRWIPRATKSAGVALLGLLSIGLFLGLSGCYPETVDNAAELDLVLTNYDQSFDFSSALTYSRPDTLIDIAALIDPELGAKIELTPNQQTQILGWIDAEMAARGYQKVAYDPNDPTPPDFFLLPGAIKTTTVVVGGGWGCYPYYYWGGCWWGYPWCCSYSYSYDAGSLVVNLVQRPSGTDPDTQFVVRWTGALNGVISTTAGTMARIENGIGQMFAQSPYLGAAPGKTGRPMEFLEMVKRGVR